jgi:hypothetical protein
VGGTNLRIITTTITTIDHQTSETMFGLCPFHPDAYFTELHSAPKPPFISPTKILNWYGVGNSACASLPDFAIIPDATLYEYSIITAPTSDSATVLDQDAMKTSVVALKFT